MSSDEDHDCKTAIVIDTGSGTTRAGFAGSTQPTVIFPTIVGRPKCSLRLGVDPKDHFVGDEVEAKRGSCFVKYPIEHGFVSDWDDMEKIWHYIFYNQLCVAPKEHPVLLTEGNNVPKCNREKRTEIMFEKFHVPALFLCAQSALTLHASGLPTGVAVESGDGATAFVPVYEGHCLPRAACRYTFAGRTLTNFMGRMLNERYKDRFNDLQILRNIKEKLCYVAYDFKHELNTAASSTVDRTYIVSDKEVITIGTECFRCPEAYFDPLLVQQEMPGIPLILVRSIGLCDSDIEADLYANIQLSGGSTMFPGFAERLRKEVENLAPKGTKVKVHDPPHGVLSAWVGGSMKAAKPEFLEAAIKYDDYEEYGPSIVHRVCF